MWVISHFSPEICSRGFWLECCRTEHLFVPGDSKNRLHLSYLLLFSFCVQEQMILTGLLFRDYISFSFSMCWTKNLAMEPNTGWQLGSILFNTLSNYCCTYSLLFIISAGVGNIILYYRICSVSSLNGQPNEVQDLIASALIHSQCHSMEERAEMGWVGLYGLC